MLPMSPLRQSGILKARALLHETPILRLSRWDVFKGLAAIVCVVGTVSLAVIYLFPAPQSKISIATAFKGGAYELFGQRYQQILARSHVNSDLLLTDGSVENLKLLQDRNYSPGFSGPLSYNCQWVCHLSLLLHQGSGTAAS